MSPWETNGKCHYYLMKYHPNQTYHVPERVLLLRPQAGWVHDNSWKCHLFVVCIGIYICSTYPNTYYNYSLQYFPVHSCCYPCWSNNCLHANASMEQGDDTIVYSRRGCALPVLCCLYILCFYTFRFYNKHCTTLWITAEST